MMKVNYWVLYSLFGIAFTFAACVNDGKDLSLPTDLEEKTAELNIPADFGWIVTRGVTLEVNAPEESVLWVYADADCSESSLKAKLSVSPEQVTRVTVDIPTANNVLYLEYPISATETKVVKVDLAEVIPSSRAAKEETILPVGENMLYGMYHFEVGKDEKGLAVIINSGTLVFEDSWPDLGDYDFNDLVADYFIATHVSTGNEAQYQNERIDVSVTIRAIGGNLPSKLGLTFTGNIYGQLLQRHIADFEDVTQNGLTVKLADNDQGDVAPVFLIEGLKELKNGKDFYNTEEHNVQEAATVNFSIYTKKGGSAEASTGFTQASSVINQDLFLVTTRNREIHLRGYQPTSLYTAYTTDAATSKDIVMNPDMAYSTDKNLVWGMKVIKDFQFPLEKVDINKAYKGFKAWIESNGDDFYANWYKNPVTGQVATW